MLPYFNQIPVYKKAYPRIYILHAFDKDNFLHIDF